jgi:hypothetical protein
MSPVNASLGNLTLAWVDRLAGDATFESLVGLDSDGTVRLVHGWPDELLLKPSRDDLPRVTWITTAIVPRSADPEHVIIASDTWDIPADAADPDRGLATVNAIDDQMLALLYPDENAATWFDTARGIYVSSVCLEGSGPPSRLIRRRRLWQIAAA